MGPSVLVAKILALYYISAGIAALSGKLSFSKMIEEYERSSALAFVTGFIAITLGMLLVEYHNIWIPSWPVLITFIGWGMLLKGVLLIAFPQSISFFKSWCRNTQAWGIVMIALGLLFGYFGFVI
jgi:predicted MFS family arabinose efflux permease